MALADQLIVEVLNTSRTGSTNIRIDYKVWNETGTELMFHGSMEWPDVDDLRIKLAEDESHADAAIYALMRTLLSRANMQVAATTFDNLKGKRFRIRSTATVI